ncbi:MAG: SDR family NAD(P)-dependent oxidoreductase [Streptosporangiaceae bacterium]
MAGGVAGRVGGRVAVVTGAAGGLGRQFCAALAGEGTATVVGVDIADQRATAADVEAVGSRFLDMTVDVTSESDCDRLAATVADEVGGATILVNNAGVFPVIPFAEMTLRDWRRVHGLNVEGSFLMTKALLPGMRDAGWGRIVNIASAVVWLGPPGMVAYTASKAALIGMTRALASELGPTGITVNAIAPGLMRTETSLNSAVREQFPHVLGNQAVDRAEEATDVTSTLLYVCDEGSAFLTGQAINVDGGFAKH